MRVIISINEDSERWKNCTDKVAMVKELYASVAQSVCTGHRIQGSFHEPEGAEMFGSYAVVEYTKEDGTIVRPFNE